MAFAYNARIVQSDLILNASPGSLKNNEPLSLTDLSGNGNSGSFANFPALGPASFDSSTNYMFFNDSLTFSPPNFTAMLAVKLTSYSTRPHLFGHGEGSIGHHYVVVETTGDLKIYHGYGGSSGNWNMNSASPKSFPLNQWVIVTACYSNTRLKLYVNDEVWIDVAKSNYLYPYTGQPMYVGKINTGNNYNTGETGQFLFYRRALSEDEIMQNFSAIRGKYGI